MSADSGASVQQRRQRRQPSPGGQNLASGAVRSRVDLGARMRSWLLEHRQVATAEIVAFYRRPLGTLLTCLVIGIALALPAVFFVGLHNLQRVTTAWAGASTMSVYLSDQASDQQGRELLSWVETRPGVLDVRYVSAEEALEEFGRLSGFADTLANLSANPLPASLVVTLLLSSDNQQQSLDLQAQLKLRSEVELVQIDMQWVARLGAMLGLAGRLTLALALLLGLGVLLVTVNTIRLAIESRRKEIVVAKLVGATDAFVRRPFLYTGLWYGLGGGLLACCLLFACVAMLAPPVEALAALYSSSFMLVGLSPGDSVSLLLGGALLGWAGAWLAVSRHLGEIAPR